MALLTLTIDRGTSADWVLQGANRDGTVPTGFLLTDTLAGTLWAGDDQVSILTTVPTWNEVGVCKVNVALNDADTATLTFGQYRLRITASRGGRTAPIIDANLQILASAGTGVAPAVYNTLDDMQTECSWIGLLQNELSDQTGFAQQRARAREWMDGLIIGSFPTVGLWGSGASLADGWPAYQGRGTLLANSWLVGILATGGVGALGGALTTTNRGKQMVRACACYATSLVLRNQISKSNGDYMTLATYFMRRAQAEASTLIVEIDTQATPTGTATIAVPLGITNTRFG